MPKRPKSSRFRLNFVQRKELARVSFDIAKSLFLTVIGGYFIPPLIGFSGRVEQMDFVGGALVILTFLFLGVILLKEVRK